MASTYAPCSSCNKLNRVALDEASSKEPICGNCKTALPLHFGIVETNGTGLKLLVEKSPLPVVADFWAPWCGPCKAFAPAYQQAAQQFAGRAVFVKVNTEANPVAGEAYNIRSIPTLVVFQKGSEKARMSGALPLAEFSDWLEGSL